MRRDERRLVERLDGVRVGSRKGREGVGKGKRREDTKGKAYLRLEVNGHGRDVGVEAWHGRRDGPGQVEELLAFYRHIEGLTGSGGVKQRVWMARLFEAGNVGSREVELDPAMLGLGVGLLVANFRPVLSPLSGQIVGSPSLCVR